MAAGRVRVRWPNDPLWPVGRVRVRVGLIMYHISNNEYSWGKD